MQTPFSLNRPIIYPLFSTPIYYVPDTKIQIDSTLLNRLLDRTEFPDFVETAGLSKNQFILDNPDWIHRNYYDPLIQRLEERITEEEVKLQKQMQFMTSL